MSKYNPKTIYIGDLIKYTKGKKEIHKKDVELIYEKSTDSFYTLDHLNYFIDIYLNERLSSELKEEYIEILNKNKLSYTYTEDEKIFVDEESLSIFLNSENKDNPKINKH